VIFLFCLFQAAYAAPLDKYSPLIVADKNPNVSASSDSIRVTYLGVNGFQFETGEHALLVDPYFTRVGLWAGALDEKVESDPTLVADGLKHIRPRIDAILVTHAHFDHLLDAPEIMRRTHARMIAGPTAVRFVTSFGISGTACRAVKSGSVQRTGPWTLRVFAAQHDHVFGKIPFNGKPKSSRPVKASDWTLGEPLAFVIEAAGKRIYIDSGGVPGSAPDARIKDVDLAILGVALPDSRERFGEAVRQLRPRYIFPSHQDDMFAPFDRGFVFGKMTNFPAVVHEQKTEKLPGRLILFDYFRPWTLR
jgi:L-ascorbate metabolism protein UlaG (beta-lactamase superfamily)